MPDPSRSPDEVPDPGEPGEEARRSPALHALADVRRQLQSAQRTLAGSMAEIAALDGADDGRRGDAGG
jgi:hypothetical protein